MSDEIAGYAVTISERLRYPLMAAFRQALEAGIRYGYLTRNPAKLAGPNPMPSPREIRVYAPDELKAIVEELGPLEAAAVRFAAATGLRPAEWAAIERRDVDRTRRLVFVRGTKTHESRREVPLTAAALSALDAGSATDRQPLRLHDYAEGARKQRAGPFDVHNFRRRVCAPAIDAAGIAKPARIYDLRSTFISNALANGLTVVRDGEDRGHEREDDRGALRGAARHCPQLTTRPARGD